MKEVHRELKVNISTMFFSWGARFSVGASESNQAYKLGKLVYIQSDSSPLRGLGQEIATDTVHNVLLC